VLLPHLLPYMLIAATFRCIGAMGGDFDKIWLLTAGRAGRPHHHRHAVHLQYQVSLIMTHVARCRHGRDKPGHDD
jgi:hypothetical protein